MAEVNENKQQTEVSVLDGKASVESRIDKLESKGALFEKRIRRLRICLSLVAAFCVMGCLYVIVGEPLIKKQEQKNALEVKYEEAISLVEKGDYLNAYQILCDLDYKDSKDRAEELYNKDIAFELFKNLQSGDDVLFVTYINTILKYNIIRAKSHRLRNFFQTQKYKKKSTHSNNFNCDSLCRSASPCRHGDRI